MTRPDREIWTGMLAYLQNQHPDLCRHWFHDLEPVLLDAGTMFVRAQSEVHRDYLRRHALDAFNDAVRNVSGQLLSIRFLGPGDDAPEPAGDRARAAGQQGARATKAADPAAGLGAGLGAGLEAGLGAGHRAGRAQSPLGVHATTGAPPPAHAQHHGTPAASGAPAGSSLGAAEHPGQPGAPSIHGTIPGSGPDLVEPKVPQPGPARTAQPGAHPSAHQGAPPPPARPRPAPIIGASEAALADHPDALNINPDHNFENFVVGRANRVAYAAAQAVADAPGDAYNPLFIHGGVGLGKTHLLQSICLRVLEHTPDAVIYYLSCEAFVTQFVDAIRAGQMSSFRHRYRDVDVLVIDDIHFLTGHDRTQEEFFHTFNSLYQARKQIVLSSDAPPEEIPDLEDRLVSRFKWGLVAEMMAPEFETRTAIVQTKAKLRGLTFPTDVASFIAERVDRNVRELEGAITTIQIRSQVEQRAIDLDLVREVMGDAPVAAQPAQPTLNQITDAVTRYFNIKVTDVQSRRRHKSVSLPRQVCMYLARKKTRYSLEEIGGFYGGRDHTTVMHAVKAITERTESERELVTALESIEQSLGA